MATVTYCEKSYACSTAIKGSNYIHLLDESGTLVAAFDGVSDFSKFSIDDGNWASPKIASECTIVVIGSDGIPLSSGIKLCDVS